jgi:hypothetical protein
LSHLPADTWQPFHQIDSRTLVGQVQAGLYAGHAASDDKDFFAHIPRPHKKLGATPQLEDWNDGILE